MMQRTSEIGRVGLKVEVTVKAIDDRDESGTFVYITYFSWKVPRVRSAIYPDPMDLLKPMLDRPDVVPHVSFQNCVSKKLINEVYYWGGELPTTNEAAYFGRVEWLVKIISRMDLTRFPYDRQKIRIILKASNCCFRQMMRNRESPSSFPDQLMLSDSHLIWDAKGEWVVDTHTTELRYEHFSAVTEICLARDPTYYICNIGTIMYIIVISGATVIAMDVKQFNARSSLLRSLLLTSVALKLVTTNYIAIKSYLTFMDYYILLSVTVILLLTVESLLMAMCEHDYDQLVRFDRVFIVSFAVLWTALHIVIWVAAYANWFRRDWRLVKAISRGVRKVERNHFIMRTRNSNNDFSEETHEIHSEQYQRDVNTNELGLFHSTSHHHLCSPNHTDHYASNNGNNKAATTGASTHTPFILSGEYEHIHTDEF